MSTKLADLLDLSLLHIADAKISLPQEAFYFVSQLTPMVNVDLLIKNDKGQSLLTWREDQFYGPAWHIPGGIVRFKEKLEDRIVKVAQSELKCAVRFGAQPINVHGSINTERNVRGHFISLLYLCALESNPDAGMKSEAQHPQPGQWAWHDRAPINLLSAHEPFRAFIDETPPL